MADDKFFNSDDASNTTVAEEGTEPTKIKLGEEEYTQEDLQRLVGLGKIAVEAEDKYNTKIDRVWPDYTKKSQRLVELEQENEGLKRERSEPQPQSTFSELTEDQRVLARRQLKELLGGEPMTQSGFDSLYTQRRAAEKLLEEADTVVDQMSDEGKPKTTVEDLVKHMSETGIRNPAKAYKDMFEDELDKLKEAKLAQLKQPGLVTQTFSTAGAKQPESVKVTRDNLQALLRQSLGQE